MPPIAVPLAEPVQSPTKRQRTATAAAAERERELAERIEANMNELVKLSDEKLTIATQVGRPATPGRPAAALASLPARAPPAC